MILRQNIDAYIKRKKLKGIVGLLNSLMLSENLKELLQDLKIETLLPSGTKVLFHGSSTNAKVIYPQPSDETKTSEPFVYATSDPNYAIFLAILNLRDASAGVVSTKKGTTLTVDTNFVNGKSTLKPGFIHIVPRKGFRKTSNNEFVTTTETPVLFSIKVTPGDLTVPIEIATR